MSEDNQNQSGNQSQVLSDNQTSPSNENAPPKLQAVEPQPKPEPSFGTLEASEDLPSLTFEKNVVPPPKPDPSFESHLRGKLSQPVEKPDKTE